ncbi:MAG TPA: 6-phosphogluconolactonase [Candidatus Acidoferrales bacterium]|jgi:6-phosphogluconolactonase|nr:6-phosphogluconolactonase [Candidatus Acidoferrales bacterium]
MQNVELLSFPTPDALAVAAAAAWVDEVESANRAGKSYSVALSGGRITQKFFLSTVEKAQARNVSFGRVHFFWADERCVPPDDPESNYKLADDLLFEPLKITDAQIHRLRGELPPEEAVAKANVEIAEIVTSENGQAILDLIHLGMGEDGHIASLFQNARYDAEKDAKSNDSFFFVPNSPKPPPRRISLNYKAIIAARNVWVLASGAGKEDALKKALSAEGQLPLGQVIKNRKKTKVFTDINV